MKRFISLMLAAVMLLLLVACGDKSNDGGTTAKDTLVIGHYGDTPNFDTHNNLNDNGMRINMSVYDPLVRMDNVLDYMAAHFDAVVIEGFGVGGLPSVKPYDFLHAAERWIQRGKVIVMATQVTEEGSDMSRYEVGQRIKCEYDLLESFDMTIESVITKMMWILGQTSDIKEIKRLFYTPVYHDLLPTK